MYSAGYISWYELFQIKEGLGPKHSLLGYNFGPKLKPHVVRSAKNLTAVPSTYEEVHELASKLDFFCWEFVFFHLEKVSWSLQATTIVWCLQLRWKHRNARFPSWFMIHFVKVKKEVFFTRKVCATHSLLKIMFESAYMHLVYRILCLFPLVLPQFS